MGCRLYHLPLTTGGRALSQIYYVLREKATGKTLPYNSKQRNQTAAELSATWPPRLFTTHAGAQNALNWWCEGVWHAWVSDGDVELQCVHMSRSKEAMEIVAVQLTRHDNAAVL